MLLLASCHGTESSRAGNGDFQQDEFSLTRRDAAGKGVGCAMIAGGSTAYRYPIRCRKEGHSQPKPQHFLVCGGDLPAGLQRKVCVASETRPITGKSFFRNL